jgi:hypothetical protein
MMISALLLPLLASQPAHAWRHTGWAWDRDLFPMEWYLGDVSEDSLPEDILVNPEILEAAWAHWEVEAPCATLSTIYMGVREGNRTGKDDDDVNTIYFDDPAGTAGSGILGVTYTTPTSDVAFTLSGDTYVYAKDSDIVFNDNIDWASNEDIANNCAQEYALEAVATHEIGHLWGLGHSCEEGELCPELDKRSATMYWSIGPCSTYQSVLKSDDIAGITALYGPYASFYSDSKRSGGAPLEVCFEIEMDDAGEGFEIEWDFGDDGDDSTSTETTSPVCHTYTEAGQFSVKMTVTGTQDECGEWNHQQRELAFVTVCNTPKPAEGFDGLFTYESGEDFTYQMVNQVDTSVYGCIEQIRWDVFKGDSDEPMKSVSAWSPKIDFEEAGDYRVVLSVGAPGDLIAADELLVKVEKIGGAGCASAPASSGIFGLLIGLAGLLIRRQD